MRASKQKRELRRLWAEGLASGPGRFGSIDEIKREARRQFAATRKPRKRETPTSPSAG